MYGAQPRCHEDTDMASLLQNIEFCTFTDTSGRLKTVVDLEDEEEQNPQSGFAAAGPSRVCSRASVTLLDVTPNNLPQKRINC